MKKIIGRMFLFAAIAAASGCEWEGFDSGGSAMVNNGFDWVNFTGTYRPTAGSGALVLQPGYTATSTSSNAAPGGGGGAVLSNRVTSVTNTVVDEVVGVGDGVSTFYAGHLANTRIVPNTLSIAVGIWGFVDNGLGALSGAGGITGTVTYATGSWTVDFVTMAPTVGEAFVARYQYITNPVVVPPVVGTNSTTTATVVAGQGNAGKAIYTMSLTQTGNILDAYDSNGDQYAGSLLSVSSTAGSGQIGASGTIVASYRLTGLGKKSNVTIDGTLLGSYTAAKNLTYQEQLLLQRYGQTANSATQSSLDQRTMTGTWMEHGPQGEVITSANIEGAVDAPAASTTQNNSAWYYGYPYYYYGYPYYWY